MGLCLWLTCLATVMFSSYILLNEGEPSGIGITVFATIAIKKVTSFSITLVPSTGDLVKW